MLYELLLNYIETFTFLNVFKYITVRTGLSFFTSLTIALIIGGPLIKFFSNKKIFNPIREDGPSDHIIKKNWNTYNGWSNNFIWFDYFSITLG